MGTLAMVGVSVHSFQQMHTVTQICATDHSNFFLLFVEKMESLSDEYIHLPRTPANLFEVMKRYCDDSAILSLSSWREVQICGAGT